MRISYKRVYPPRGYYGVLPVYLASFEGHTERCYVRRNGPHNWETAEVPEGGVAVAEFSACPVALAAETLQGAVEAWAYFHIHQPSSTTERNT